MSIRANSFRNMSANRNKKGKEMYLEIVSKIET